RRPGKWRAPGWGVYSSWVLEYKVVLHSFLKSRDGPRHRQVDGPPLFSPTSAGGRSARFRRGSPSLALMSPRRRPSRSRGRPRHVQGSNYSFSLTSSTYAVLPPLFGSHSSSHSSSLTSSTSAEQSGPQKRTSTSSP